MKRILAVVFASTLAFSANMAGAKDKAPTDLKFPTKDITYLVPYSAGGSSDQMARAMVNYAKKYLGVNLIIENVGGGGGNVGLVKFAGYKPDGHSVVSANTSMNLQPIYGTTQ